MWTMVASLLVGRLACAQQWLLEIPGGVGAPDTEFEHVNDIELHPSGEIVGAGYRRYEFTDYDPAVFRVGLDAQSAQARQYLTPAGVGASLEDLILEPGDEVVACGASGVDTIFAPWIVSMDRVSDTIHWECSPAAANAKLSRIVRVADGYVAVGYVRPDEESANAYVVKVDLQGELLWQRRFAISEVDVLAQDVVRAPEGGVFMSGVLLGQTVFFMHIDAQGELQRSVTYETDFTTVRGYMAPAADGGFFIASPQRLPGDDENQPWIARIAADGSPIWQYRYETMGGVLDEIRPTADGGCLLVGTRDHLSLARPSAMRIDQNGVVQWCRYYELGDGITYEATGVELPDGGALLATTVNAALAERRMQYFRVGSMGELESGCEGLDTWLPVGRSVTSVPLVHMPVTEGSVPGAFETLTTTPQHYWLETSLACGDPCATPVPYCVTSPNSVGPGGSVSWLGSTSIAANDFALTSTGLPPSTPGVYFFGSAPNAVPFADGTLCVSAPTHRLGLVTSFVTGDAYLPLDLTDLPAAAPPLVSGSRLFFQLWYRDPTGGPAGSNLTNGLDVTFCP